MSDYLALAKSALERGGHSYARPRIIARGRVRWLPGKGFMAAADSEEALAILVLVAKAMIREAGLVPGEARRLQGNRP